MLKPRFDDPPQPRSGGSVAVAAPIDVALGASITRVKRKIST
jgi:hypothetical protein